MYSQFMMHGQKNIKFIGRFTSYIKFIGRFTSYIKFIGRFTSYIKYTVSPTVTYLASYIVKR